MSTNLEKFSVPFSLNPNKIATMVDQDEFGPVGYFILIVNILAVGFATVLYSGPLIGFIPSVTNLSPLTSFLVGIIFQSIMILFYSYTQNLFLKLFNVDLKFNNALQLVTYVSVWFSLGVLVMTINLPLGIILASISFISLVFSHKAYLGSDLSSTFFGVLFATIVTGLAALSFTFVSTLF